MWTICEMEYIPFTTLIEDEVFLPSSVDNKKNVNYMKTELKETLTKNILPFWSEKMIDQENGGFYGRIDGRGEVHPQAEKGAILNARILWAFAAAYRVLRKPEYLDVALRAKQYIIGHFIDHEYGGVYWSLDYKGQPLDTKKQSYAIGFTIYGMSELARATGDEEALSWAQRLFRDLEEHAFDSDDNGYVEALTRDWQPIADMRLSDKDENGAKTMNTHLHIIEPYTNLLRVWRDPLLEKKTRNLLDIFLNTILNKETFHLDLFFDDQWQGKRNIQSFGHDIEASWLLHETALVLADKETIDRVEGIIPRLAEAAREGLRTDGAMVYEKWTDTGVVNENRDWWVQCECIIGHVDLYQYFGERKDLEVAENCWTYVKQHLLDNENGEWHWGVRPDGSLNLDDDKAGFWKCPYHNARLCLEIIERPFE